MNAAPEIKGWCPGALRPMQSGDGLLLRAKAVGPRLTAPQALELAAIALTCGNGLLDLSQRAQLQLRGVSEATLDEALRRLADIDLLAEDAGIESVLNILAPPLAGFEATMFDACPLVSELAAAIASDLALRALPGKFLFLIDDGADPGLADSSADIRLEAASHKGEPRIAIVLDGEPDKVIVVPANEAVETVLAIARAYLTLRRGWEFELRRMRFLVEAYGAASLAREAGLKLTPYRSKCHGARWRDVFGVHARGSHWYLGVAAPFGRWSAQDLMFLAERAVQGELRLSPWRAILIPASTRTQADDLLKAAAERDLIVDGADPRLSIIACPGAPECPQSQGVTRSGFENLAPLAKVLQRNELGASLHISGCAKGCAKSSASRATIVPNGTRFDLIVDGRASDPPTKTALSLDEIEAALRELVSPAVNVPARVMEGPQCPAH